MTLLEASTTSDTDTQLSILNSNDKKAIMLLSLNLNLSYEAQIIIAKSNNPKLIGLLFENPSSQFSVKTGIIRDNTIGFIREISMTEGLDILTRKEISELVKRIKKLDLTNKRIK